MFDPAVFDLGVFADHLWFWSFVYDPSDNVPPDTLDRRDKLLLIMVQPVSVPTSNRKSCGSLESSPHTHTGSATIDVQRCDRGHPLTV